MKKITMKISKLVLPMVIGCFFSGCATNALSKDTAISWGNKSPNSTQKYGVLRVGISQRGCLYRQSNGRLQINNPPIQISRIGAFFSSQLLSKKGEKTKIGIRLIPYVINKKSGNRLVLVPNNQIDKFYLECYGKYHKIVSRFLKYYPIMLFKVDSEKNRDLLITRLKSLRTPAKRGFNKVNGTATTIGGLLQKIFRSERVKFLEGLPFNVCVELIDEANMLNPPVKFHVINDKTLPLPCDERSKAENEQPKKEEPKETKEHRETKEHQETKEHLEPPVALPGSQCGQNAAEPGQHKLIVLSLSKKFSLAQQKALQKSLISILLQQEQEKSHSKFTLFAIQQGRKVHQLLSYNELLSTLANRGENFIQKRIEGVQFGASDLRALDDLGLVDFVIQEKAGPKEVVGGVLYLTDNIRLYPDEKPPSKQRGVPLVWCEDGISLTVLTTKECETWEKYTKAQCYRWQNKPELELKMREFLQ